jgi:hypothetical protein
MLERHRARARFRIRSYVGWGVLMGAVASLIATCFRFVLTAGVSDSLLVIGTSCCVGGMIPLLLSLTFPERSIQKDRENKSCEATGDDVSA